MNVSYIALFQEELNGRVYSFTIPLGAPYVDCHEIAAKFSGAIVQMEKEAADAVKKEQEAAPAEAELVS